MLREYVHENVWLSLTARDADMTPLEQEMLNKFADILKSESVNEKIVTALLTAFGADKLPTADAVAATIRQHSGGVSA
jgi:hypothetical protein